MPVSGSVAPFSEYPMISPRAFIEVATLQLSGPGSVPKSVTTPSCHLNAWNTKGTAPRNPSQMETLVFGGLGMAVAEAPTVAPRLFIWLEAPCDAAELM
jgi:hypothetical protein